MNHEELLMAGDAIINDMLLEGGTPEAVEIASERMKALPASEDELLGYILIEFDATDPTPEQRARFLAALGFVPETESRLQAAQRLYWTYRESLTAAVCEDYPSASLPDVDRILSRLRDHLSAYRGTPTREAFLMWAIRFVYREAETLNRFTDLYGDGRKRLVACLARLLGPDRDLGSDDETLPALESEVWQWVWTDKAGPLHKPDGTATPVTRIIAYAKGRVRGWKTDQLRRRAKFTSTGSDVGMAEADAAANPLAVGARKPAAE